MVVSGVRRGLGGFDPSGAADRQLGGGVLQTWPRDLPALLGTA